MNPVRPWRALLGAASLCCAVASHAGVLERIASGGKLVVAYRDAASPFAFKDAAGRPAGYAVELCQRVAEAVRRKTGRKGMEIAYVPVDLGNRMEAITQGGADLECGSSTNNAERRQNVAFTIPHFITGTRLLVKASSPIERIEDMGGHKLVSTRGTTALRAVQQLNREHALQINVIEAPDDQRAVEMVEKGEADAFAMDDVLLYAFAAGRPDPKALKVVGKFVTAEALAIMLPKDDPEFKKVVDDEMRRLISSREIHPIYDRWFLQPAPPTNRALNLPVSYLLREFWKYPSDQVPF
ncbi:amino acid ABC transporter substrate-binding protein [Paracidovorax citrulli]|nr:amino acid ABC transporter substrate-binding protein [Paracidovorax citrulli]ATG94058.1 amino acid ABC transporter substrate-binding protein [Paracidovorax citrulli]MVT37310.1 transporter substrate-binding domain-containing protein [Paracidovorax citrulli]PVY64054.1 amino acid ABC transporter substrate-binding protein (PAAT family) [Paracidovorax citrulli]REG66984.1 amino acid ABC transporter substrate-binding protein (PAAT family) [Paracidovorax citrulli]RLJ91544.1 amino acid ABC transport